MGEDLQPACQHVKDQHQLGRVCKTAKVLHGAHQLQARADVVQVAATAVKFVTMSKPFRLMSRKDPTKMKL